MPKDERNHPDDHLQRNGMLSTNRLFVISLTIYAFVAIFVLFHEHFHLKREMVQLFIVLLITTAFCMNLVGVFMGIRDRHLNMEMAWNGIIGNVLVVLAILILLGIGIYFFYKVANMDFSAIRLPLPPRKG